MIKEVDESLQMLNGENYDVQFEVKNKEEFIKDVIEYFSIEEDEVNDFMHIGNDEITQGEYVYSSLGGFTIKLEDALNNEFELARDNIENYNQETQEMILEWFNEDIEEGNEIIEQLKNNDVVKIEGNEYFENRVGFVDYLEKFGFKYKYDIREKNGCLNSDEKLLLSNGINTILTYKGIECVCLGALNWNWTEYYEADVISVDEYRCYIEKEVFKEINFKEDDIITLYDIELEDESDDNYLNNCFSDEELLNDKINSFTITKKGLDINIVWEVTEKNEDDARASLVKIIEISII